MGHRSNTYLVLHHGDYLFLVGKLESWKILLFLYVLLLLGTLLLKNKKRRKKTSNI